MSKVSREMVKCPKCGKESEFEIWTSLNTMLDPGVKEKVINGELFTFECPYCEAKTHVDYSMLFHQMDDSRMIYYIPRDDDVPSIEKMFRGEMSEDGDGITALMTKGMEEYIHRIVRTQNSMIEKIKIFDDGLDDRIIEIVKLFTTVNIYKEKPQFENFELYYDSNNDNLLFAIVGAEQSYGTVGVPMETYESIRNEFEDRLPNINSKVDLIIDFAWAKKALGLTNSETV